MIQKSITPHVQEIPKKMRIILFTVDDTHFVPKLNKLLTERYGSQIEKVYISKSLFGFRKLLNNVKFFLVNNYPFCIQLGDLIRFIKWKSYFSIRKCSVSDYFSRKGLNVSYIDDINTNTFLDELRELKPDVFLFSPFDKIAKSPFINIPSIGTFNLHLGKLPEYRGGLSSFWVLRNSDQTAGATFHEVIETIDAGDIISEIRFHHKCNSMKELMDLTVEKASGMLLEGIKRIEDGNYDRLCTSARKNSYYLYPSKRDFRIFYQQGNRLV